MHKQRSSVTVFSSLEARIKVHRQKWLVGQMDTCLCTFCLPSPSQQHETCRAGMRNAAIGKGGHMCHDGHIWARAPRHHAHQALPTWSPTVPTCQSQTQDPVSSFYTWPHIKSERPTKRPREAGKVGSLLPPELGGKPVKT